MSKFKFYSPICQKSYDILAVLEGTREPYSGKNEIGSLDFAFVKLSENVCSKADAMEVRLTGKALVDPRFNRSQVETVAYHIPKSVGPDVMNRNLPPVTPDKLACYYSSGRNFGSNDNPDDYVIGYGGTFDTAKGSSGAPITFVEESPPVLRGINSGDLPGNGNFGVLMGYPAMETLRRLMYQSSPSPRNRDEKFPQR